MWCMLNLHNLSQSRVLSQPRQSLLGIWINKNLDIKKLILCRDGGAV